MLALNSGKTVVTHKSFNFLGKYLFPKTKVTIFQVLQNISMCRGHVGVSLPKGPIPITVSGRLYYPHLFEIDFWHD